MFVQGVRSVTRGLNFKAGVIVLVQACVWRSGWRTGKAMHKARKGTLSKWDFVYKHCLECCLKMLKFSG